MWKKTKRGVDISQTYGMKERPNNVLWFVTMHRSHAQIFEHAEKGLKLIREFAHPEGRMKGSKLVSDHPGRSFDSYSRSSGGHQTGVPRHSMGSEVDPKSEIAIQFAKSVAEWIETARTQNHFTHLLLIAEPHLMGILRSSLSRATRRLVQSQLEKDYAWLSQPELEKRLLSLLPATATNKRYRFLPRPFGVFQIPKDKA